MKSEVDSNLNTDPTNTKVFVGLSGGVDSAVSAALLKQQGYDVHGVFIQTWTPDWMECTWRDDRRDAMRVAIHLGIPFHDLDLVERYKTDVAEYMIAEYRAGRTPNPDVMCNRAIKFGGFWDYAQSQGAQYVATGHYARVADMRETKDERRKKNAPNLQSSVSYLLSGIDSTKDQSYFLWMLNQDDLSHVLFPVGHLHKSQVRELAQKFKLPVAQKKDSQGICFLGQVDMQEFLKHYIDELPGDVVTTDGVIVGKHAGVMFITIGQRLGAEITDTEYRKQPVYVLGKDIATNTLIVAHTSTDTATDNSRIRLQQVNDYTDVLQVGARVSFQIRYHGELYCGVIVDRNDTNCTLQVDAPAPLVASGQSVVFYDGEVCLGGGIVV